MNDRGLKLSNESIARRAAPAGVLSRFLLIPAFTMFSLLTSCAELDTLRARTEAQEAELVKMREENSKFQSAYYQTKQSLEGQVNGSQKTLSETQRELEEARSMRTQKEKDLEDRLRKSDLEFSALKNDSVEQKRIADAQIAQMQQNLQSMTSERNAALGRLTDMDKKLAAEAKRSGTLTDQVAALSVSQKQLTSRLDAMQADLTRRDQELAGEKTARAAAEKENGNLEARAAAAEKRAVTAEQTAAAATKARNDAALALDAAKAHAGELQQKAEAAAGAGQELQKVREENAALQKQLGSLKAAASVSLADDARLKDGKSTFEAALGEAPDHKGAGVRLDKSGLRVILPSDLLFGKSGTTLTEGGKSLLRAIAPSVADLAKARTVHVEGHTDNQPISSDLPYADNWGLGSARADRVRAFLVETGVGGRNMTSMTRAQNNPLASNDNAEGRAQNRRVEIVIGAPAGG